ncbi:hypothetical protein [Sulfobacillus thermosulfidooxidans]|uniref:hypothetical protein n=1 Tax=Sulfobacillus thermosulfidooxidans TaxID=28034 RepID=UPI0006B418EB|nr:hypothetical protein [Sulfobacillus thermosulfidooxidans]
MVKGPTPLVVPSPMDRAVIIGVRAVCANAVGSGDTPDSVRCLLTDAPCGVLRGMACGWWDQAVWPGLTPEDQRRLRRLAPDAGRPRE